VRYLLKWENVAAFSDRTKSLNKFKVTDATAAHERPVTSICRTLNEARENYAWIESKVQAIWIREMSSVWEIKFIFITWTMKPLLTFYLQN